jgi:hypothetical protein
VGDAAALGHLDLAGERRIRECGVIGEDDGGAFGRDHRDVTTGGLERADERGHPPGRGLAKHHESLRSLRPPHARRTRWYGGQDAGDRHQRESKQCEMKCEPGQAGEQGDLLGEV